eukprot:m.110084 g.110084  ORF g.110084 m.110084 type:complete len:375 (+) comp28007_c0_seq1:106-1230(+)
MSMSTMYSKLLLLVGVTMLTVGTRADLDTHPGWTRVARCENHLGGLDLGLDDMAKLANAATQVRICSYGSTVDCVTSNPNTFPIQNIQKKNVLVSQVDTQTVCNPGCIASTWTGPQARLNTLQYRCTSRTNDVMIYHACGNEGGLHFDAQDLPVVGRYQYCNWDSNTNAPGALEMFINAVAPTTAPTQSPSAWYQHGGHLTNFTEVQTRLVAVEEFAASNDKRVTDITDTATSKIEVLRIELDKLTYDVGQILETFQVFNSTIIAMNATLNTIAATQQTTLQTVSDNTATTTNLQTQVNVIRQALVAAVDDVAVVTPSCAGGACSLPSIEADGASINILAADGNIMLTSKSCSQIDMCQLSKFTENIKAALKDL